MPLDPQAKEHLWAALNSLASAPVSERTLTGLAVLLQSQPLKQALGSYCVGGPHGQLLDAESEHLGEARVQAFETEGLVGSAAAPAVLSYLFHRIEAHLDGAPTMIIIDEGWLVLDSPAFAAQRSTGWCGSRIWAESAIRRDVARSNRNPQTSPAWSGRIT